MFLPLLLHLHNLLVSQRLANALFLSLTLWLLLWQPLRRIQKVTFAQELANALIVGS
jgi:hypothetical protein